MALYFISLRDESASHIIARSYAVALFRILKPHFSPAAAWYLPIVLCAVFPRAARKNRTQLKWNVPLCRTRSCAVALLRTLKPHTIEMERSALPKAEHANCVSPIIFTQRSFFAPA